jgi:hypothetical protein
MLTNDERDQFARYETTYKILIAAAMLPKITPDRFGELSSKWIELALIARRFAKLADANLSRALNALANVLISNVLDPAPENLAKAIVAVKDLNKFSVAACNRLEGGASTSWSPADRLKRTVEC